jgi:enoyl-CoA hydratase/carnithine racemase
MSGWWYDRRRAGAAFSAGANLKNPRTHSQASMAGFIEALSKRHRTAGQVLTEFGKPVVAAVNGFAVGIGCIVTYCCDLIIASDRAEWRLPQVALGILPNHGGIVRLARWVGKGQAMKVAIGYPMQAGEAFRFGLARWLVPHNDLLAQTTAIAERLPELPPLASRLAKESLNRARHVQCWRRGLHRPLLGLWRCRGPRTPRRAAPPGARGGAPKSAAPDPAGIRIGAGLELRSAQATNAWAQNGETHDRLYLRPHPSAQPRCGSDRPLV